MNLTTNMNNTANTDKFRHRLRGAGCFIVISPAADGYLSIDLKNIDSSFVCECFLSIDLKSIESSFAGDNIQTIDFENRLIATGKITAVSLADDGYLSIDLIMNDLRIILTFFEINIKKLLHMFSFYIRFAVLI
jgi:hypothetical protein